MASGSKSTIYFRGWKSQGTGSQNSFPPCSDAAPQSWFGLTPLLSHLTLSVQEALKESHAPDPRQPWLGLTALRLPGPPTVSPTLRKRTRKWVQCLELWTVTNTSFWCPLPQNINTSGRKFIFCKVAKTTPYVIIYSYCIGSKLRRIKCNLKKNQK